MNNTANDDVTISELLEFLKDNMATKDDIKQIWDNMATKDDLKTLQQKMEQGFAQTEIRFSEVSTRFDGVDKELEDIKAHLARVEKMAKEDADAAAKEIVSLKQRVSVLEKIVMKLQAA